MDAGGFDVNEVAGLDAAAGFTTPAVVPGVREGGAGAAVPCPAAGALLGPLFGMAAHAQRQ